MTNTDNTNSPVVADDGTVEARVAAVFSSLLIEKGASGQAVEVTESGDFFDLGGNSMLAARLVVKLRKEFDVNLSIRDVFRGRTVDAISRAMRDQLGG